MLLSRDLVALSSISLQFKLLNEILKLTVGALMLQSVVRVGSDDCGTPHPVLGSVLQPQSTGSPEATAMISGYTMIDGQYGDGEAYSLRRPDYSFAGTTPSFFSVRLAPQLIGLGLLEAVSEDSIMALADLDDADADGVSGRVQALSDPETGATRPGRFNHKGGQARLSHQIAAALNTDMGVTTDIFPLVDGESKSGQVEFDSDDLAELTRYVATIH